jgi:hypothetical protein
MRNTALVLSTTVMLFAGHALSVDLKNEDNKKYDLKVTILDKAKDMSIDAKSTLAGICGICKIEAPGVGAVEAKGSQVVVIKDGKMVVE